MAATAALGAASLRVRGATQARVAVVGGGWGGLACARALRQLDPGLAVTLVEREPVFLSLPLSTLALAGVLDAGRLVRDARAAAARHGYVRIEAEVRAIDRERRRVVHSSGTLDYDWLVLAPGIRYDWSPWFGDDVAAAARCAQAFPCGFRAPEFTALQRVLAGYKGGDLLINVPPQPSRCPPAPYERVAMLAARIRREKLPGRIVLLDPGPGALGFRTLFAERYRDEVQHVTHATITGVDMEARRVRTEFDEFRFDAALLAPPQQAGEIVWQAGLIGRENGKPTGWAALQPLTLRTLEDERVFVVGDAAGAVSPLFGHYPKSAQIAVRMGQIAAAQIVARAGGRVPTDALPESVCHVTTAFEPREALRIAARHHVRGDGLIAQTVRQQRDPQPRGEDEAWWEGLLADVL